MRIRTEGSREFREPGEGRRKLLELEKEKKYVFHGTPGIIKILEPRQATTHDEDIGRDIEDGTSAVFASPFADVAIFRALIRSEYIEGDSDNQFGTGEDGRPYFVASKNLIDAAKSHIGRVYVLDKTGFSESKGTDVRNEKTATPSQVVEVDADDLPNYIEIVECEQRRKDWVKRLVGCFSGLMRARQQAETQHTARTNNAEEESKMDGDLRSRIDLAKEEELMRATVKLKRKIGTMPGGVFYAKIKGGGAAIFKPDAPKYYSKRSIMYRGEEKTYDQSEYSHRERAAYLIDRFLGLNMVPTTVIRKVGENIGSLQKWIDGVPGEDIDPDTVTEDEKEKLKIFDFLLEHKDRGGNGHHPLRNTVLRDGKIYAVDNSFILEDSSRKSSSQVTYLPRDMADTRVAPQIIDGLKQFLERPESTQLLREMLGELIEEKIIDRFFVRIRAFKHAIEGGVFDYKKFEKIMTAARESAT